MEPVFPALRPALPLLLLLTLGTAARADGDDLRDVRRAKEPGSDYLRTVAPWMFVRTSPAIHDAPAEPIAFAAPEPTAPEPLSAGGLALTPGEALLVRMNAGLTPPAISRATVMTAGFEPVELVLPSFAEVPGGIVFGTTARWPAGMEPSGLTLDASGGLSATFPDGSSLPFAEARADDLLACLRQARATKGSDALVSIVRSGRIQLSEPFASSRAGAVLVRADLAPFAHVQVPLAQKSLVVDREVRIERAADGSLVPLADLEVRFYRVRDVATDDESLLLRGADRPARLVRMLTFAARATATGGLALEFAEQDPAFWRLPPPGALAGLERDLAAAARLAAWTALFRDADERGFADLDQLEARLAPLAARAAAPSLAPPARAR